VEDLIILLVEAVLESARLGVKALTSFNFHLHFDFIAIAIDVGFGVSIRGRGIGSFLGRFQTGLGEF